MPLWIQLHPERGRSKKCWNGCPLRRDKHDGRRYGRCENRGCRVKPKAGTPVLGCRNCGWAVCTACARRPRMPALHEDPLLQGPENPCLLLSEELLAPQARARLPDGPLPAFAGAAAAAAAASRAGPSRSLAPALDAPNARLSSLTTLGGGSFASVGTLPSGGYGTVIICPGGNYEFLSCLEGQPVVDWLASHGLAAGVLRYRLLPAFGLEDALDDLEDAINLVRALRRGPVVAIGFSAGGHLVASLGARCEERCPGGPQLLDGQVLVYPGIDGRSWDPERTDEVCFYNHDTWEWPERVSSLLHRQEALLGGEGFAAPPTFLVTSTADGCIPRSEVQPYVEALRRADVPHVHLRKNFGDHGFGLNG
jgi:acetyl esterase/lipase